MSSRASRTVVGKKPRLLFAPHTDTVSVGGMTIEPFGGEVRDGRVWGRGASDTKGTMAAMLWALRSMRERLPSLGHEVWFAGLCSEEAGQYGARTLAEQERFDFVVAGEPTGLDAVVAHKGALWLTLTTRGRAVHAAEPERGENAIYKMADVLRWIRDDLPAVLGTAEHPLLGRTTVSAGTVNGGSKINIVPDSCTAEVDIRYLPGDETMLERVCAQTPRDLSGSGNRAPVRADAHGRIAPGHPTPAKMRLGVHRRAVVQRCRRFCRRGNGRDRAGPRIDRAGAHPRRVDRNRGLGKRSRILSRLHLPTLGCPISSSSFPSSPPFWRRASYRPQGCGCSPL